MNSSVVLTPPSSQWLKEWSDAVYASPQITASYTVSEGTMLHPSLLAVYLLEQFPSRLANMIEQVPDAYADYKRNQQLPIYLMARCIQGWYRTCDPSPTDWVNLKTVLGWIQKEHGSRWRTMFDGERPSLLTWLQASGKALTHEIDEITARRVELDNKKANYQHSRFWSFTQGLAIAGWMRNKPQNITDRLCLVKQSITFSQIIHLNDLVDSKNINSNIDYYPEKWLHQHPLEVPVAIRDYSPGWDTEVRTRCKKASIKYADSFWTDGVPDKPTDRVLHLNKMEEAYDDLERTFEPWRWHELYNATLKEKAEVWAWMTSWAPVYHWNTAVKNMGLHPSVESIGLEYTGRDALWWMNSRFEDKVNQALSWIGAMENEKYDSIQKSSMDDFVKNLMS